MLIRRPERSVAPTTADLLKLVLWPLALLTIANRIVIKAGNGHVTDDFRPVYAAARAFREHLPVYTANFDSTDPHYLYPPSGTLFLAPLAFFDHDHARWVLILANVVAIVLACYLLLRLFGFRASSVAAPLLLVAMFASESVTNTLVFTNINGCLLLAEVLFLRWLLHRHDLLAGAALGVMIAVKITPGALLLIALARGQWKVAVGALVLPLLLLGIAWPLSADPVAFFTHTMPYLSETRDYFNSAIVGNGAYYGVADWLVWLLRLAVAALVGLTLWLLYRDHRDDELFFVCTASGVLLLGTWLLSSLGQMYYSMLLAPFLMTVVLRDSVLRNWPAWLAVFGFLSYDKWLSDRWPSVGRDLEYLRVTFGWGLLLLVTFCVLGDRYLAARRATAGIPSSGASGIGDDHRRRLRPGDRVLRRDTGIRAGRELAGADD
ncbi:glycosyltransferase family 87 protein [Nocardia sp. NPDC048505]|uniref:glycosyltransferase family 87 protein n=1 Tax=unclassified Nocardia TaxID=2637762 RepID=UPI0033C03D42